MIRLPNFLSCAATAEEYMERVMFIRDNGWEDQRVEATCSSKIIWDQTLTPLPVITWASLWIIPRSGFWRMSTSNSSASGFVAIGHRHPFKNHCKNSGNTKHVRDGHRFSENVQHELCHICARTYFPFERYPPSLP